MHYRILLYLHVCFSQLDGDLLEVKACVLVILKSPKHDIALDSLRSVIQMLFLVKGPLFLLTHKLTNYVLCIPDFIPSISVTEKVFPLN